MKLSSYKFSGFFFLILFSAVSTFSGCQQENPYSPAVQSKITRSSDQLTFITSRTGNLNKSFSEAQLMSAAEGGTIRLGDNIDGYSSIQFLPGDLGEDTNIKFEWDSQNHVATFTPHGLVFNSPVRISLSYKNANVLDSEDENLRIWYYNEDTNLWELVDSKVNQGEKTVEGYIYHFSKYSIAKEE